MADRLASARMTRAWMRETVFEEAKAGERIVVCLRSHRHWGLESGRTYGVSLFSPNVNRAGYILLGEREPIAKAVRQAVFG
jgi:hypothetical protein